MIAKPKVWAKADIPTPPEMAEYLSRIRAARNAFRDASGFPEIPETMDHLTFETANNLERVLLMVHSAIETLEKSRIYSGELQSGGF